MSENTVEIEKQVSKNATEMAGLVSEINESVKSLSQKYDNLEQDKVDKMTQEIAKLNQKTDALKGQLELTNKAESSEEEVIEKYRQSVSDFVLKGQGKLDPELSQKAIAKYIDLYSPKSFSKGKKEKIATKLFSADIAGSGGFLIMPEVDSEIRQGREFPESQIRSLARIQTVGSNSMSFPYKDKEFTVYEKQERQLQDQTSDIDFAPVRVDCETLTATIEITTEMLEDATGYDIENYLVSQVGDDIMSKEGDLFFNGKSSSGVKGLNTYELSDTYARNKIQKVNSGTSNGFGYDDLINLTLKSGLQPVFRSNATMIMNTSTFAEIFKIQDAQNRPIFNPAFIQNTANFTFMDAKIALDDYMTTDLTQDNARAIYYGDFRRAYVVLDRRGLLALRDPYSKSKYGSVEIVVSKRVGGGLINFDALRCLNVNNT